MADDSDPSIPQNPPQSHRGRARPTMGGSGLFETPMPPIQSPKSELISDLSETNQINKSRESTMKDSVNSILDQTNGGEIDPNLHSFFQKIGTRIHMDSLIRSNGGIIAQLDPNAPGIVHISKKGTVLSDFSSKDLMSSNLGMTASDEAPDNHRLIFVLLAQLSLNNPGRGAAILTHSPWTIAASSNEDLFVLEMNKIGLGRIAIVDQGPEEKQIAEITEAVTQLNGPAIVIRNQFVLGFGLNLETVSANLTLLEHEMQRQYLQSSNN
jgi:hypothetical protein